MPVTAAELTTTVPPDAVNVSDWVAESLTWTLPNAMLAALTLRLTVEAGALCAGVRAIAKVTGEFQAFAERVAVWAVETAATFAENVPLEEPAGMDNVAGTVTAALLLARVRVSGPGLEAAYLSVTLQESVPAPAMDASEQDIAFTMPEFVVCAEALAQMDRKAQTNISR